MANLKIVFLGQENTHAEEHELICYLDEENRIYIELDMKDEDYSPSWIYLDKSTAIKLAKTLRTEINKMEV